MELIATHPEVDAVIYLGLGIQANQARLMRRGRFYPGDGLERIVDYHERQDARFAQAAADISDATGKPILLRHRAGGGRPGEPRAGHGPGHADGSATRRPIAPSAPSTTSGSAPASSTRGTEPR